MPADLSVNSDDDSSYVVQNSNIKYSNFRRSSVQVTPDEMTSKNIHLSSPYARKLINVNVVPPPKRERSFENKIGPLSISTTGSSSKISLSKTDHNRKKRKLKKNTTVLESIASLSKVVLDPNSTDNDGDVDQILERRKSQKLRNSRRQPKKDPKNQSLRKKISTNYSKTKQNLNKIEPPNIKKYLITYPKKFLKFLDQKFVRQLISRLVYILMYAFLVKDEVLVARNSIYRWLYLLVGVGFEEIFYA